MSSGSDQPFDSVSELVPFHDAIPYYVAWKLTLMDGDVQRSTAFLAQFENYLKTMESRCKERPNYLPSASGGRN